MPRFLDLPQQLCAVILREWLGNWKALSSLDIAYSNRRARGDLLAVLNQQVIRFDDAYVIEGIARRKYLTHYLAWIRTRTVRLHSLHMHVRLIPDILTNALCFPHIKRITFIGEKRVAISADQFRAFIACFPQLQAIDCSRWTSIGNTHLAVFLVLNTLKVLNLDYCDDILGMTVVRIACKYATSLRELRCVMLDDEELLSIAEVCHAIRTLSIACDDLTADGILCFCRANPLIEALTLSLYDHASPSPITDDLLIEITKICTKLHSIHIDTTAGVSDRSFQHIISQCPDITSIKTFTYQYTVKLLNGHKCSEFAFGMVGVVDEIKTLLQHVVLPVTHVNAKYAKVKLDRECLHLIAEKCGSTLIYLSGDVDEDVNPSSVEYLLSRCPCLQTLMLSKFGTLTNDTLIKIPSYCPQIRILGLECAKKITDVALLKVLDAYRPNQLTSLGLHYCRSLTIAILIKIAQQFPRIDWVLVQGTAMHRDLVWQAVVVDRKVSRFGSKTTIVTGHKKWFEKELEMKVPLIKNQPKVRLW